MITPPAITRCAETVSAAIFTLLAMGKLLAEHSSGDPALANAEAAAYTISDRLEKDWDAASEQAEKDHTRLAALEKEGGAK